MKTSSARSTRRSHDLLREFFACAVVIAAIKSGQPTTAPVTKSTASPSPSGRA
jgi:hypothetical protein